MQAYTTNPKTGNNKDSGDKPETDAPVSSAPSEASPEVADPFDQLDRLRLPQNFGDLAGVKKLLVAIPVRKPHRQEFIRIRPDPEFQLETALLKFKEERDDVYLVAPELWDQLAGEIIPARIVLATTPQGANFLWHIRLPRSDGRKDEWSRTSLEAARIAQEKWIRVVANMSQGSYDVFVATGNLPDPEWPDTTFAEALKLGFHERYIDDPNHPVLKSLRGEL